MICYPDSITALCFPLFLVGFEACLATMLMRASMKLNFSSWHRGKYDVIVHKWHWITCLLWADVFMTFLDGIQPSFLRDVIRLPNHDNSNLSFILLCIYSWFKGKTLPSLSQPYFFLIICFFWNGDREISFKYWLHILFIYFMIIIFYTFFFKFVS